MELLKAHYRDERHDTDVWIQNRFTSDEVLSSLRMTIDGIEFCGMDFCDWALLRERDADTASQRFALLSWGSEENGYEHSLQRFSLDIELPMQVLDQEGRTLPAALLLSIRSREDAQKKLSSGGWRFNGTQVFPDKIECDCFSLKIGGETFRADRPDPEFELSLLQICKKLKGRYLLKCCFGCLFSDYSPYGSDYFATMLCYSGAAERYLRVTGKYGKDGGLPIWDVYAEGVQRQETFLCNRFQPRIDCLGGYRGTIY